nr:MAG TPA: tail protein [Caudoviricetes sp.]
MVQSVVINIKNTDVLKTGIAFSQGDKGAEAELQIFVKDDEAYVLNAEKAEISFERADGHVVIGELTGSDGVYSYHFSGNELQSAGDAVATVTLTFSDGRISSGAFSFQVRYNPMFDKSIEAGPYIWQLEKIVENAKTYTEYLENLIAQLKPEVGSTVLTKADLLNDFSQTAAGLKAMDAAVGKRIWDNFGNYIPSEKIVNNLLATQAGNVLDATQGKVLGDKVAKMEQSITELNSDWQSGRTAFVAANVGRQSVSVNFQKEFSAPPRVFACWNDNENIFDYCSFLSVKNVSKSGFEVCTERKKDTANWWFFWLAIATKE